MWLPDLNILYILFGGLSLVGSLVLMLTYVSIISLWRHPTGLIFFIGLCDFAFSLQFFLAAIFDKDVIEDSSDFECVMEAWSSQFFGVATVLWNFCISLDFILTLRRPLSNGASRAKIYHLMVWGFSTLTTILLFATNNWGDTGRGTCWIAENAHLSAHIFFFFVPLAATGIIDVVTILMFAHKFIRGFGGGAMYKRAILTRMFLFALFFMIMWGPSIVYHMDYFVTGSNDSLLINISGTAMAAQGFFTSLIWLSHPVVWSHIKRHLGCGGKSHRYQSLSSVRPDSTYGSTESSSDPSPVRRRVQDVGHGKEGTDVENASLLDEDFSMEQSLRMDAIGCMLRVARASAAEAQRIGERRLRRKGRKSVLVDVGENGTVNSMSFQVVGDADSHHSVQMSVQSYDTAVKKVKEKDFLTVRNGRLHRRESSSIPGCDFKDYVPFVFAQLRRRSGILDSDYVSSLNESQLFSVGGSGATSASDGGRSGSFMWFSADKRYIIKTLPQAEKTFLLEILHDYYGYLTQAPDSLLVRFLGLHRIRLKQAAPIYFIVMDNLFGDVKVDEVFDLKGSWVSRESSSDAKVQKDLDFHGTVDVPLGHLIFQQIRRDVKFLKELNIMDYSLLLGLCQTENLSHETRASLSVPDLTDEDESMRDGLLMGDQSDGEIRATTAERREGRWEGMPVPLHRRVQGGILSRDGKVVYFMGLIDILQEWNAEKKVERFFKTVLMRSDQDGVSSIPPGSYSRRFLKMISRNISHQSGPAASMTSEETTNTF